METTAAVFTGAEQQYKISWSQQRIQCLSKIWGERGRKQGAPVETLKREGEALGWGKQAPDGWFPLPVRIKANAKLLGPGLAVRQKSEFWICKIPQRSPSSDKWGKPKPKEVNLLKVTNACVLVNKIRMLLTAQTAVTKECVLIVTCGQHGLKSWISLATPLFSFSEHFWFCGNLDASWPELAYSMLHKKLTNLKSSKTGGAIDPTKNSGSTHLQIMHF